MKAKHVFVSSLFSLLALSAICTPALEARHRTSTHVQFNVGVNIPPAPRPYHRETYIVREYHTYPQPCRGSYYEEHVYVYPSREVHVYHAPRCPHCR